jgi:hypothetical protein
MARGFLSGFAKASIFRKLDVLGAGSDDEFWKDGSSRVMRLSRVGLEEGGVGLGVDGDEESFGLRGSTPEVSKRACMCTNRFEPRSEGEHLRLGSCGFIKGRRDT